MEEGLKGEKDEKGESENEARWGSCHGGKNCKRCNHERAQKWSSHRLDIEVPHFHQEQVFSKYDGGWNVGYLDISCLSICLVDLYVVSMCYFFLDLDRHGYMHFLKMKYMNLVYPLSSLIGISYSWSQLLTFNDYEEIIKIVWNLRRHDYIFCL